MSDLHHPEHPVRFVTASSLFDGHDASINIMRRILQSQGAEVIHLGHNRSVQEVVDAAVEEDVQGVAVSSYQGGHVEYFEYLVESLARARRRPRQGVRRRWRRHRPRRDRAAARSPACTIFSPEDGQRLGLAGMINTMIERLRRRPLGAAPADADAVVAGDRLAVARAITGAESRPALRRPAVRGSSRRPPQRRGPRARHHRHRRLRQVLADRRAGPPVPRRPGGQAPRRRHRRRPDPAPRRRRAARRPDPDERPRRRPGLLPLAGHPRRPRAARRAWPT